jgi:ABC-type protease/lipase transport system fused ATPase/permease subunit
VAQFIRQWRRFFTFAALLSCLVNILQLIFPFYMFTIYGNIVVSYSKVSLANISVIAFYAILILGGVSFVRSRLLAMAGKNLTLSLRRQILSGMVAGVSRNRARAYRTGLNDLDIVQNYVSSPSIYSLFDAPWSPFYLVLIFLFQPALGVIAASGALVMIGLSVLQDRLTRPSLALANMQARQNQGFVDSFIRNVEVVNGMGMIPAITQRFLEKNRQVIFNQTQASYHAGTIQALIKPLQNVIQVLIYCAGAVYAMLEGMDVGLVVAASIIMGRALVPLMQVTGAWRTTQGAREAYLRLKSFSEFLEKEEPTMTLPDPSGRLQVEGAVFRTGPHVVDPAGVLQPRTGSADGADRAQRCRKDHLVPSGAWDMALFRRPGHAGRQ